MLGCLAKNGINMKRDGWAIPGAAIAIAVGSAVFLHYRPHNSGEIASWVQALGSIGAIIGAFKVGQRQANAAFEQAIRLRELEARDRAAMVAAIVDAACRQCSRWTEKLDGIKTEAHIPMLQLDWGAYGRPEFDAAFADINGISLLGLPTPGHVEALVAMRKGLIHAQGSFERLMKIEVSTRPESSDMNGVTVVKLFLDSAEKNGRQFIKLSSGRD